MNRDHETFTLVDGYDKTQNPASATYRRMTVREAKRLQAGGHATIEANDGTARQVKINGGPKVWKRTPGRVEVPLKYGLYEYATAREVDSSDGENGYVEYLVVEVQG